MTKTEKLALMKDRYETKANTPKNLTCPGVFRALKREIRNLENVIANE